jgi:hypothetical protein
MGQRLHIASCIAFALAATAARAAPAVPPVPKDTVRDYEGAEYRTDTFSIELAPSGEDDDELEYKVRMKAGATLVYSWSVDGISAEEFYADLHGAPDKTPLEEVSYKAGLGVAGQGALVAPFDGIHGWLFKNDSVKTVTVKLTVAGYYDLLSLRETMGLDGAEYVPWGPADWPERYGPVKK